MLYELIKKPEVVCVYSQNSNRRMINETVNALIDKSKPLVLKKYELSGDAKIGRLQYLSNKFINKLLHIPIVQKWNLKGYPIAGYYTKFSNNIDCKRVLLLIMGYSEIGITSLLKGYVIVAIPTKLLKDKK